MFVYRRSIIISTNVCVAGDSQFALRLTFVHASSVIPAPAVAAGAWQSPAHGQHSPAPGRTALSRAAVHIPQWRSLLVNWPQACRPSTDLGGCVLAMAH